MHFTFVAKTSIEIVESFKLESTSADCLVQPSCSEQGQLQQVAQGCVQLGFEHLQRPRLLSLSGKPVPLFE